METFKKRQKAWARKEKQQKQKLPAGWSGETKKQTPQIKPKRIKLLRPNC